MNAAEDEDSCRGRDFVRLDKSQKALSVQLVLSLVIGLTALFAFCVWISLLVFCDASRQY